MGREGSAQNPKAPCVSTGIPGLDKLLGGGIPRGYLLLVAGGPGVGKTILSVKYIYEGAKSFGDNGVYVCFAETRDVLVNSVRSFGWDLEAPDIADKIAILDLSTKLDIGVQQALNQILETVISLKAKRLVIDSFTAMSMAMKERIEMRYLMHLVYKFLKRAGCTSILIVDVPWGGSRIGSGSEEFIADGVILMENFYDNDGHLRRRMRVLKLRGAHHSRETIYYELTKEGIELLGKESPVGA